WVRGRARDEFLLACLRRRLRRRVLRLLRPGRYLAPEKARSGGCLARPGRPRHAGGLLLARAPDRRAGEAARLLPPVAVAAELPQCARSEYRRREYHDLQSCRPRTPAQGGCFAAI